MDRQRPPWLDETFLAIVLQGGEGKEPLVEVTNFTAKLAVAPGNNYLSYIFRVKVEYKVGSELKTTSIIVKAPVTKGVISDMSDKMDVFGKELKVYETMLPKINEKLSLEVNPTFYFCPIKALVLRDLKDCGYVMVDKCKQFDFAHCRLALTLLAKFHAASVSCYHEDPNSILSVGEEIMFVSAAAMAMNFKTWLQISIKTVIGLVANIDDCQPAVELLSSRCDSVFENNKNASKQKKSGLNVVNHGDFWMNNMMFKHDESGKVTDVKFLDFQITRYTSPALDVAYFIWTSCNEDVRESRIDELLYDVYLQTLNSTLKDLNCEERMSEEELKEDLKGAIDWAIMAICNVLPMAMCESENAIDMEEVTEEEVTNIPEDSNIDERFMKIFQGKSFNSVLPGILKHLHKWVCSLNRK